MSDSTYPLFPVFALLGFVLALVPLSWHLEAWNSATCYFMAWASLACLNQFVNSIIWANSALNIAPVWCDISAVGLPAASMCINRRLYKIARLQATTLTTAEKRRAILIDTLICVLFPIVCMILAFIVQGHRFNIYEEIGCSPATYNTLLAYFLVNWWPVTIGMVSAVYCVLSLRAFSVRRSQFSQFITSKQSPLTFSRYFRLMALATTEMLLTIPISSYLIYLNATTEPLEPWVSWSFVHVDFSRVEEVPAVLWKMDNQAVVALRLGQWLNPVCALVFFAYFGVASEARRNYARAFLFVARVLGISRFFAKKADGMLTDTKLVHPSKSLSSDILPPYSPPSSNLADVSGFSSSSLDTITEKPAFVTLMSTPTLRSEQKPLPPSPLLSPASRPLSPASPLSPSFSSAPPDSAFGSRFDHSIAFTDIESLYGARLLSCLTANEETTTPLSPHLYAATGYAV